MSDDWDGTNEYTRQQLALRAKDAAKEAEIARKDAEIERLRAALEATTAMLLDSRSPYISGSQYDEQWDKQRKCAMDDATALLHPEQGASGE